MYNETNLVDASIALARLLNVRVTAFSLRKSIEQNASFPSLFSLSETFNRYKIPNESFRLKAEQLPELEAPFIAFWKSDFVLVTKIAADRLTYQNPNGKSLTVPINEFAREYGNVVFIAEPDESSGEPDYEKKAAKEKGEAKAKSWLLAGGCFVLALIAGQFVYGALSNAGTASTFGMLLVTLAKLIGLSAALLLLTYELDKSNALVKSLCSAGKQTSCDAVLNSKASRVLGWSWSEIGFFYFAATTLFLFYPGISFALKTPALALGSTLAAPYVLFSIYYQWRVVKQWCPLCLAAQTALVLELGWNITNYWMSNPSWEFPDAGVLMAIAICLLLPVVIWNIVKPLWTKAKQAPSFEASYKRLLYNPEMFYALLNQQAAAPEGWDSIGITLGNPAAKKTILKVCNPFCGPCAKAHPVLEEIIHRNPDYNVKVIFTSTNESQDRGGYVARHLLAVAHAGNGQTTQQAMDDWYMADKKDYEHFAGKYPMNGEVEKQKEKLAAMNDWCKEAAIAYTPTIFINGRRLPETYGIEELKNIL